MKESLLYTKLNQNKVQCHTCAHECFISENKAGFCGVRQNINQKLFSLVYGKVVSEAVDPIEKKPFFHFLPGSQTYSYATVGCNLRCDNCQNWQISQYPKLQKGGIIGQDRTPEQIVHEAKKNNCDSVAATYTEPTVFLEFALDVMRLAKQENLKNIWVSNGFMSKKTLDLIIPYLDAINIDLKFFDDKLYSKFCGAKLQPVLDNLKYLKQQGVWVEVTTLVIPDITERSGGFCKIVEFIFNELGAETPWHVSRFSPEISYKLQNLFPTPINTIKDAIACGKKIGLKNIYAGNVWDEDLENTHCPKCGTVVINRKNYETACFFINGSCPKCGQTLDIIL
ncbi:MAG: AmmeMemoRadiSam system radical SAM enzyme [Patescibacteria group bacterium]